LVIVLLLSHFGWFGISDPEADSDATAGQSGIVIPVTLETAQRAQEAPSPEPEPEPEPMSESEVKQEPPAPVSVPTPVEPPSALDPEIAPTAKPTIEPAVEPAVKPTVSQDPALSSMRETPAQTRVKSAATADSGKAAGSVQQRSEPTTLPLTPAHVDPNYLHRPNPVYPTLSKRLREEGTVLLRVNLDAQGIVLDISIEKSSSFQRLDQAALEAVKQWRFVPAKRGQETMPSTALVPIEFKQQ
jgi:protein TonB